jgi:RNA polymerase sigma-70 factor (ECF subfamily)
MNESRPNIVPLRSLPAVAELELDQGDDEQLMALAAGGAKAAFAVLVGRHMPKVTQYCARFAGQLATAEELAQEIFLEVWVRRMRYRSQGKFVVFLFTLARHRCLNRLRDDGRRRRRDVEANTDGFGAGACPPDQLETLLERERQRRIQAALLGLSTKLREAVLLRFDQGLDYPDVARIVGCSESTTRSRVRLAMLRLRDELAGGSLP